MNEQLSRFGVGAKFVSADALTEEQLGPLKALVGEWDSVTLPAAMPPGSGEAPPSGWNVISVPGKDGFVFEVIPYVESLKFSACAVMAGNRGPVFGGTDIDQTVFGLFYEQQIKSVCDTDFCRSRGFGNGVTIHAETGMFLYITDLSGGYSIARLSTIPHGNAVLALGTSFETKPSDTNFFEEISAAATNLDDSALEGVIGYNDPIIGERQFPAFPQATPNSFLKSSLDAIIGKGALTSMTTLTMSTNAPNSAGGILNIPFVQKNATAASLDATFWLQTITGGSLPELLQYSQTINLIFPPAGTATPIKWPHIAINTLRRRQGLENNPGGAPGVPQL